MLNSVYPLFCVLRFYHTQEISLLIFFKQILMMSSFKAVLRYPGVLQTLKKTMTKPYRQYHYNSLNYGKWTKKQRTSFRRKKKERKMQSKGLSMLSKDSPSIFLCSGWNLWKVLDYTVKCFMLSQRIALFISVVLNVSALGPTWKKSFILPATQASVIIMVIG